ncbi:Hypothetical protein PHPALM_6663 [Phytophthora palmivora]|uniref:Uncharacterized protein n=1 Tax=Phytophthora palmivora TaxID=4796 RepID=A0A2P4YE93_9STRA|nr:Hypothetical protein PHPALM_6663 [Phytophthora palmivora]
MATPSDSKLDGTTPSNLQVAFAMLLNFKTERSLSKTDFVTSSNVSLDAKLEDYISYVKQVLDSRQRETKDSQRALILTVNARKFESVRQATYEFELFPVSVDRIDIMESKL